MKVDRLGFAWAAVAIAVTGCAQLPKQFNSCPAAFCDVEYTPAKIAFPNRIGNYGFRNNDKFSSIAGLSDGSGAVAQYMDTGSGGILNPISFSGRRT